MFLLLFASEEHQGSSRREQKLFAFTAPSVLRSSEKSGWIALEAHPASQLRSNARALNSGRLPAVPFHRNQLACSSSRSNWRQTFSMAAGLVDPSEAVPRRRWHGYAQESTKNRSSPTIRIAIDDLIARVTAGESCGARVQAAVQRCTFGHPFHNLLPPRHPMPPCLDTLPPALGAPHN